jgi:hypothetical protein
MVQSSAADNLTDQVSNDGSRRHRTTTTNGNEDESMEAMNEKILSFWKEATKGPEVDKAFDDTMCAVNKQIEALIRTGLDAFHRWENTSRELTLLQDECKGKEIEFERLRVSEEKNRATVSVRTYR